MLILNQHACVQLDYAVHKNRVDKQTQLVDSVLPKKGGTSNATRYFGLWLSACIGHLFINLSCRTVNTSTESSKATQVDWAEKIIIPTRFSAETSAALQSGVLFQKARDEIVNSLSTLILVHNIRPTSDDYNTVCNRLIKKHTVLKDHIGSGFVSQFLDTMSE